MLIKRLQSNKMSILFRQYRAYVPQIMSYNLCPNCAVAVALNKPQIKFAPLNESKIKEILPQKDGQKDAI